MADNLKISYNYLNPYEEYYNKFKTRSTYNRYTDEMFKKSANYGELDTIVYTLDELQRKTDAGEINFDDLSEEFNFELDNTDFAESVLLNELYGDKEKIVHYEEEVWNEETAKNEIKSYDMSEYELNKMFFKRTAEYNAETDRIRQEQEAKDNRSGGMKFLSALGDAFFTIPYEVLDGMATAIDGILSIPVALVESSKNEGDFLDNFAKSYAGNEGPLTELIGELSGNMQWRSEVQEWFGSWSHLRDVQGNYTTAGQWFAGTANSIGQMIPSMLVGKGLGKLGVPAKAVSTTQQALYYAGMSSNTFREFVNDPRLAGVSAGKKLARAATQTAVEWAIQGMLNKCFGPSMMDKAVFGYKGSSKVSTKIGRVSALRRIAGDAAHEGLEEMLQQYSNYFVDMMFAIADDKYKVTSEWDFSTAMTAFGMGALSSIAMSTFSVIGARIKKPIKAIMDTKTIEKAINEGAFSKLDALDSDMKLLTKQMDFLKNTPYDSDSQISDAKVEIDKLQSDYDAKQAEVTRLRSEYKLDKLTEKAYRDGEIVSTVPKMSMLAEWDFKATIQDVMQAGMSLLNNKKLSNAERGQVLGQMIVTMENIASIYGSVGEEIATNAQNLIKAMQENAVVDLQDTSKNGLIRRAGREVKRLYSKDKALFDTKARMDADVRRRGKEAYAVMASTIMDAVQSMQSSYSQNATANLTEEGKEEVREQTEKLTKKTQRTVEEAVDSLEKALGSDSLMFQNDGPEQVSVEKTIAKRIKKKAEQEAKKGRTAEEVREDIKTKAKAKTDAKTDAAQQISLLVQNFCKEYKLTLEQYDSLPKEIKGAVENANTDMSKLRAKMDAWLKTVEQLTTDNVRELETQVGEKLVDESGKKIKTPDISDAQQVVQELKNIVIDEPVEALQTANSVDAIAKAIVDLALPKAILSNIRYFVAFDEIYVIGKDILDKPAVNYEASREDVLRALLLDKDFIHKIVWSASEQVRKFVSDLYNIIKAATNNKNTAINRQTSYRLQNCISNIKQELRLYCIANPDVLPEEYSMFDDKEIADIRLRRYGQEFLNEFSKGKVELEVDIDNENNVRIRVTGDERYSNFGEVLSSKINNLTDNKQNVVNALTIYKANPKNKAALIVQLNNSFKGLQNNYENGRYFKVDSHQHVIADTFLQQNDVTLEIFSDSSKAKVKASQIEAEAKIVFGDSFSFSENSVTLRSQLFAFYNKMFEEYTGGNYTLVVKSQNNKQNGTLNMDVQRKANLSKNVTSTIFERFNISDIYSVARQDIGIMTIINNKVPITKNGKTEYVPFCKAFEFNGVKILDSSVDDVFAEGLTISDLLTNFTIDANGQYSSNLLSKEIQERIRNKYKSLNPELAYAYLHEFILNASNSEYTIHMRTDGSIVGIGLKGMKQSLKNNYVASYDKLVSNNSCNITDIVKSEFIPSELKNVKVQMKDLDAIVFGYYDASTKTIVLNKNKAIKENIGTLMHEYRHAIQTMYHLTGGFDTSTLFTKDAYGNYQYTNIANASSLNNMISDLEKFLNKPKSNVKDWYIKYIGENVVNNIYNNAKNDTPLAEQNCSRYLLSNFIYLTCGEAEAFGYAFTAGTGYADLYPTIIDYNNKNIVMPWGKVYNVQFNSLSYRIDDVIKNDTVEYGIDSDESFLNVNFAFIACDGTIRVNRNYQDVLQYVLKSGLDKYLDTTSFIVNTSGNGNISYTCYIGTENLTIAKYSSTVNLIEKLLNSNAIVEVMNVKNGLRMTLYGDDYRYTAQQALSKIGISEVIDRGIRYGRAELDIHKKLKKSILSKLKNFEAHSSYDLNNILYIYAMRKLNKEDAYYLSALLKRYPIDGLVDLKNVDAKEYDELLNQKIFASLTVKDVVEFAFEYMFDTTNAAYHKKSYNVRDAINIDAFYESLHTLSYDDYIQYCIFEIMNNFNNSVEFYKYMRNNDKADLLRYLNYKSKNEMLKSLKEYLAPNLSMEEFKNVKIPYTRIHRNLDEISAPFVSIALDGNVLGLSSTREMNLLSEGYIKVDDVLGVFVNNYDSDNIVFEALISPKDLQKSSTKSYFRSDYDKNYEKRITEFYGEEIFNYTNFSKAVRAAVILADGSAYATDSSEIFDTDIVSEEKIKNMSLSEYERIDKIQTVTDKRELFFYTPKGGIIISNNASKNYKGEYKGKYNVVLPALGTTVASLSSLYSFIYKSLLNGFEMRINFPFRDAVNLIPSDVNDFMSKLYPGEVKRDTDEALQQVNRLTQYARGLDDGSVKTDKIDNRKYNQGVKSHGVRTTKKGEVYISRQIDKNSKLAPYAGKSVNKKIVDLIQNSNYSKLDPRLVDILNNGHATLQGRNSLQKYIMDSTSLAYNDSTSDYTIWALRRYVYPASSVNSARDLALLTEIGADVFYALNSVMVYDKKSRHLQNAILSVDDINKLIEHYQTRTDIIPELGISYKSYFNKLLNKYNAEHHTSKGTSSVDRGLLKYRFMSMYDGTISSGYRISQSELSAVKSGFRANRNVSTDETVGKVHHGQEEGDLLRIDALVTSEQYRYLLPEEQLDAKEDLIDALVEYEMSQNAERKLKKAQDEGKLAKNLSYDERLKILKQHGLSVAKTLANKDYSRLYEIASNLFEAHEVDESMTENELAQQLCAKKDANLHRRIESVVNSINRKAADIRNYFKYSSKYSKAAFLSRYSDIFNEDFRFKEGVREGKYTAENLEKWQKLSDKLSEIRYEVVRHKYDHGEKSVKAYEREEKIKEKTNKIIAKEREKIAKKEAKYKKKIESLEKTVQQLQIGGNNFTVTGPDSDNIPQVFRAVMETTWTRFAKTNVQLLADADELHLVQSMNEFIKTNAETLAAMSYDEVREVAKFLANNLIVPTDAHSATEAASLTQRYQLYAVWFDTYLLTLNDAESRATGNALLDTDAVKGLENFIKSWETHMGRGFGSINDIIKRLKPFKSIVDAFVQKSQMEEFFADYDSNGEMLKNKDGSPKSTELNNLAIAIRKNNKVEFQVAINKLEQKGWDRWAKVNGRDGKSLDRFLDRFWKFQRMAMLSSPGTIVRNIISNTMVKGLNAASDAIGGLFSKLIKHKQGNIQGQWRMDAKVTSETESWITREFFEKYKYVDYKGKDVKRSMYDILSDGLTKWTAASDKKFNLDDELAKLPKLTDQAKMDSNELAVMRNAYTDIFINMIGESVRTDIFMKGQFGSSKAGKALNKVSQTLFKFLSDDPWIRSATKKYFGKILQESINDGKISAEDLNAKPDTVEFMKTKLKTLQLFSKAYTLAAYEYMHRTNFITQLERQLSGKSKTAMFLYKQFMPFASAAWNWFTEGLNYTPMGLVKAVVDYARLEKKIAKAESKMAQGKYTGPDISFMQYLTKRAIGKGIIGTVGFGIGLLLAGFGILAIDDEDDKIKININGLIIDVSDIFGTSSLLAGAGLVSVFRNDGNFWAALTAMNNQFLEDSIFTDLHMMFSYDSVGDAVVPFIQNKISTIVPNIIKNANKLLYTHTPQYSSGMMGQLERWGASMVPGLVYAFPRRFDPYTGEYQLKYAEGETANWFQKFAQVLGVKIYRYNFSNIEAEASAQGVRRGELTCRYDDIDDFDSDARAKANEYYGQKNNKDLQDLYNDKIKYKVLDKKTNKYVEITYSKMTTEQKKAVIERIMSNNSKLAKIYVYTQVLEGKYYASVEEYKELTKLGIKKNVYKENKKQKGFIT